MTNFTIPVFRNKTDHYDDSKLISEQVLTLNDGRPVIAQLWAESGYTFLTYFYSSEGIENLEGAELLSYLEAEGIKVYRDNARYKPEIDIIKDSNDVDCWRVTFVIGESEE